MVVLVANDLPDSIRGKIKRWFIELRANFFVSGIKDATAERVAKSLIKQCPAGAGLCLVMSRPDAPGYKIIKLGDSNRELVMLSGLQLIRQGTGDPKLRERAKSPKP